MHTPDQARELWCPMVRIPRFESVCPTGEDFIVGGCNSDGLGGVRVPNSCRCISDKCAMWRWEHTTGTVPIVNDEGDRRYVTYEYKTVRTHGYCGLAGRLGAME